MHPCDQCDHPEPVNEAEFRVCNNIEEAFEFINVINDVPEPFNKDLCMSIECFEIKLVESRALCATLGYFQGGLPMAYRNSSRYKVGWTFFDETQDGDVFPLEMSLQEFAMPLNKKRNGIWNFVLPVEGAETRICNDIEEAYKLASSINDIHKPYDKDFEMSIENFESKLLKSWNLNVRVDSFNGDFDEDNRNPPYYRMNWKFLSEPLEGKLFPIELTLQEFHLPRLLQYCYGLEYD